ncbi:hypothetical protein [Pararhizobium haloflavum]|uniref:hypothetical protein n=1 Tax=Pararhizobium haloflavum TaxID=2037914 RepID=UPI0012FFEC44|nr:hypothetical protein [Pararhizobium haloflavum]
MSQLHVEPDCGLAIRRFAFSLIDIPDRSESARHFLMMFERFERAIIVGARSKTREQRRAACLTAFDLMVRATRLN